jgi:putative ABC transport system ATP-binding protein
MIATPAGERVPDQVMIATRVVKTYGTGDSAVSALRGVSATFARGQFTAIMGPSGSGKSTFLHCLAGLDTVTSGTIVIGDVDLTGLSRTGLAELRRDRMGFVFQSFNLLPILTAEENIRLTARLAGRHVEPGWFDTVVDALGLRQRLEHRPSELSGGQQQRVALARALITRPEVLFGDEPTGALDSATGREVLALLRGMAGPGGRTIVMVTHDPVAASWADRVVFLVDGRVHGELSGAPAGEIAARMTALEIPRTTSEAVPC